MSEQRTYHDLRACIDRLIAEGWSLCGRDPVRLERGTRRYEARKGLLLEIPRHG